MTDRGAAANQFIKAAGWDAARRSLLAGDASNRRYDRLIRDDGISSVFMDAPPDKHEDVRPFIKIADYLLAQGLSAPQILAKDAANGFLLIEDLGDAVFARLMDQDPTQTAPLYAAATDALIALHQADQISLPICDSNWLVDATALFFEWYINDSKPIAQFDTLFRPMVAMLDGAARVVILRDYHVENLIWLPDRTGVARVGLLDFQDALLGHPAYDLVSILQDARRDVAPEIEAEMIARYAQRTKTDLDAFHAAYALLGLQRNLRILGIFTRLCLRDGKAHYVDLIPRVWGYVQRNLGNPALADLDKLLGPMLPEPTPEFLKELKFRCATHRMP